MNAKEKFLKLCLGAGDIILMYAALFLAIALRTRSWVIAGNLFLFIFYFSFVYLLWLVILFALDFYEFNFFTRTSEFISRIAVFSLLGALFGIAYFYFRPQANFTPKTILLLDIIIFDILFYLWRTWFRKYVLKNFHQSIVIVGSPDKIKNMLPHIKESGYTIHFFFGGEGGSFQGIPILSDAEKAVSLIREEKPDIIFTEDDFSRRMTRELLAGSTSKTPRMSHVQFFELVTKRISLEYFDEFIFFQDALRPGTKVYDGAKRIFDIIFSLIFLVVAAVLTPFIALAIRLDSPGSIFYRQERIGKEGKTFFLYKFRTMYQNNRQDAELWREKHDDQITRVGRFLRRFHLDEVPQLWSILKGDLSFVGPRPEWIKIGRLSEEQIPFYKQRYAVKPGFTGWAQINFPPSASLLEVRQKLEYDLYYIKNRSFFFDCEIALKTIRLVLKSKM